MSRFVVQQDYIGDLSTWDVSKVTSMDSMFRYAWTFNRHINDWDVSSVTDMPGMFSSARFFNGYLSSWDVSNVRNMSDMFSDLRSFNSDLSAWDVSSVTDMSGMFHGADSFNSDLSGWNVSSVTDMTCMFDGAYSFNQNLGNWYIVLDNTSIDISSGARKIGNIATQNPFLDSQNPTYGIGSSGDSALFAIDGDTLRINPSVNYSDKTEYVINITSTGKFGTNNFRVST